MNAKTGRQGFTIIELMISIVATAILVLAVTAMLILPYRTMQTNLEYANLRRAMSFAVRMLAKDIRESSFSDISTAENTLTLAANAVRPRKVGYSRNAAGGVLNYTVNDVSQTPIITAGLTRFNPIPTNNPVSGIKGLVLDLEMTNRDGDISLAHRTFIHTRN